MHIARRTQDRETEWVASGVTDKNIRDFLTCTRVLPSETITITETNMQQLRTLQVSNCRYIVIHIEHAEHIHQIMDYLSSRAKNNTLIHLHNWHTSSVPNTSSTVSAVFARWECTDRPPSTYMCTFPVGDWNQSAFVLTRMVDMYTCWSD